MNETCGKKGVLIPFIPFDESWNQYIRGSFYMAGLLYCFMGVAIIADIFMGAIEKITSKTRKVYLSNVKGTEPEVIEVRIWNDTVANLTLMALGSSAPEFLLSVIEICGNNFESGVLGPGTIIGSSAFNLLAITAVCILVIPNGETRSIRSLKVFLVTSGFSLFSNVWLLVILDINSKNVVEIWEAALTLLFFPIFVVIAWWADRNWVCGKTVHVYDWDQQAELGTTDIGSCGESEVMLERRTKFLLENGEVNKQALVEFYKYLRLYPDLSDSDAAILAATKLLDNQPHSRMWYRIGAVRGLSGGKKVHPVLSQKLQMVYHMINENPELLDLDSLTNLVPDHGFNKSIVEFQAAFVSVPESIGKVVVTVVRHGRMDNNVRVRIESLDGTAKEETEYLLVNEVLWFGPYAKEREVSVMIIDDDKWELDKEFFLRLSLVDEDFNRTEVALGKLSIMEIVILNDDVPGNISLRKCGILVKQNCKFACIELKRENGTDGEVSVQLKTIDGSAKSPKDFKGGNATIVFKHSKTQRSLRIPIVNDVSLEKDKCFEIELFNPTGGAKLGKIPKCVVTITNDDVLNSVLGRLKVLTSDNMRSMQVHHDTWISQILDALTVNGGNVKEASTFDYFMHVILFVWKVLFSLIPPPGILGGWLCFFCSLVIIGLLTAVIGDLAGIFGCLMDLKDTVTAITFVALGTSLPDLFASKVAAIQEKYADNAIGNVTRSNVFLGLGLPWLVATIYHRALGGEFVVKSGALRFSVLVYSCVSTVALLLLLIRRYSSIFGNAELGGPKIGKWFSGLFLIGLWFLYILLSSLQAYGYIKWGNDDEI